MSGKLCFPWSGRMQDEVVARGCEAELRGGAFPSGAWERGLPSAFAAADREHGMDHLLVRAARRGGRTAAGVGDAAGGRWDPEFYKLRGGLSFFEFSENVELATRCSLLPQRFGVDAIILFYDITTLPVAMGLPFTLKPNLGPMPDQPIRTLADVERLSR